MNQTPSEQMATFATAVANECKATRAVAESAKEISDSVTGTGSTWSSSKISSELTAAKNSVKNELGDRISTNADAIESLEATTAGKVSFDAAQNLTDSQKTQARANIGAASQSEQASIASRLSTAESNLTSVTATANSTKSEVASLSATVGTKANDNSVVKLDGNQTIAGTKTFSSTIVGSISGNAVTADSATKATQDGNGDVITDTYLTKTDASTTYLGKTAKASSATTADSATKATQDASGNVITSTYATKASLASVATSGEYSDLSGVPTALKNPTALTLQNSAGTSIGSYDGSTATTVKLTSSTVGLGNVTNESKATMFTSAALTGTPTAPTAPAGTNTTQVATTAFVTTAVANKTSVSGNAGTATKLATAKTIALSGDVSGSADFDGSKGITITTTVADDSHNHIIGNVDGLQTALDAKAPLASPTLTGTPEAPTAQAGTNTTQIATTAFVTTAVSTAESSAKSYTDTKVANLVNSAPETLDTLGELATALSENIDVTSALNSAIGTKANSSEVVKLSGDQTIAGTKTFSSVIAGTIQKAEALTATLAISGGGTGGTTAEKARQNLAVNIKTYTTYEQLGLSGTPADIHALVAAIPNSAQFVKAFSSSYAQFGLPFSGTLIINKSSYGSCMMWLTQESYNNAVCKMAFGYYYDDSKAVTWEPLVTGDKYLSTYTDYSQLGLSAAPSSMDELLLAIPESSFFIRNISSSYETLGMPTQGMLTITKRGADTAFLTLVRQPHANVTHPRCYHCTWYQGQVGYNWREIAHLEDGVLPIESGGTGASTAAGILTNLGLTATATELNYMDGVTSNVQTQLNAKAASASPTFTGTPTAPTATAGTNTTQIATTAFVTNAVTGITSSLGSLPQVGDIKLFHGTLGGSDGRRPLDGITGLADEAWELCDGTNGTPDMRGQLAYGAGGTLAVGAAHGAPATSVDKAGFDYALGSRSGQPTTPVLTNPPQGIGLYYLKKTS